MAIIEIVLGAVFGNLGFLQATDWMTLVASLGGILLTFLAGTEININLMREKYKESFLIGFCSFLAPFIGVSLYTYFVAGWNLEAALIGGIALSTTSLAVVYSVLMETDMSNSDLVKIILAATFVTDLSTALALSIIFIKPDLYTILFIVISIAVIALAAKYSKHMPARVVGAPRGSCGKKINRRPRIPIKAIITTAAFNVLLLASSGS